MSLLGAGLALTLSVSAWASVVPVDSGVAEIKRAISQMESAPRDVVKRLNEVEKSLGKDKPLRHALLFYRAKAQERLGKRQEAIADLAALAALKPGRGWERRAYADILRLRVLSGQWDLVGQTHTWMTRRFGAGFADESLRLATVDALRGPISASVPWEALEKMASFYPLDPDARRAFSKIAEAACQKTQSDPKRARETLLRLGRLGEMDRGLKSFVLWGLVGEGLEKGASGGEDLAERYAELKRAKVLPEATRYLETLLRENRGEDRELEASARFFYAKLLGDQRRFRESVDAWIRFTADFSSHTLIDEARQELYTGLTRLGDWEAAARGFEELSVKERSDVVRWNAIWAWIRAERYQRALTLLERPRFLPDSSDRAGLGLAYWRARVLERLGRQEDADAAFRQVLSRGGDSYYAWMIAARRKDLTTSGSLNSTESAGTEIFSVAGEVDNGDMAATRVLPGTNAAMSAQGVLKERLDLVARLVEAGLSEAARLEASGIPWNEARDSKTFLEAQAIAQRGGYFPAVRRMVWASASPVRVLPASWNGVGEHQRMYSDVWQMFYPRAYWKDVRRQASQFQLDPHLLLALMRTESFYDQDAMSSAGARGLMQLMPSTAVRIATEVGVGAADPSLLARPSVNIKLGAAYLNKLMAYYEGNVFMTAAAYNAGPVNLDRWISGCGRCEMDEFVENISYKETRRYVKEVVRAWANYSRIYGKGLPFSDWPKIVLAQPQGQYPY
jgi:soluble lytic murein transglycosylase